MELDIYRQYYVYKHVNPDTNASELDVCTMTVWRTLNGENKNTPDE